MKIELNHDQLMNLSFALSYAELDELFDEKASKEIKSIVNNALPEALDEYLQNLDTEETLNYIHAIKHVEDTFVQFIESKKAIEDNQTNFVNRLKKHINK
jgi:hypothetical protein